MLFRRPESVYLPEVDAFQSFYKFTILSVSSYPQFQPLVELMGGALLLLKSGKNKETTGIFSKIVAKMIEINSQLALVAPTEMAKAFQLQLINKTMTFEVFCEKANPLVERIKKAGLKKMADFPSLVVGAMDVVEMQMSKPVAAKKDDSEQLELVNGVASFYEMTTVRNLNHSLTNSNIQISNLKKYTTDLIKSFSVSQEEKEDYSGVTALQYILKFWKGNLSPLKPFLSIEAARFVKSLLATNDLVAFYQKLKEAVTSKAKQENESIDELIRRFSDEINARLPENLRKDTGAQDVANAVSSAFMSQKDHGGGALLSGFGGSAVVFGDGGSMHVRGDEPATADAAVALHHPINVGAKERMVAKEIHADFYSKNRLPQGKKVFDFYSGKARELPFNDENERAIYTIERVVYQDLFDVYKNSSRFNMFDPQIDNETLAKQDGFVMKAIAYGMVNKFLDYDQAAAVVGVYFKEEQHARVREEIKQLIEQSSVKAPAPH